MHTHTDRGRTTVSVYGMLEDFFCEFFSFSLSAAFGRICFKRLIYSMIFSNYNKFQSVYVKIHVSFSFTCILGTWLQQCDAFNCVVHFIYFL